MITFKIKCDCGYAGEPRVEVDPKTAVARWYCPRCGSHRT